VLSAADVIAVNGPDSVVVELADVPVALGLAHVEVPPNEQIRQQCQAKLKEILGGEQVRIKYEESFGTQAGSGRVHLFIGTKNVNVQLVAAGLARYLPGSDPEHKYGLKMAEAEVSAKEAKRGFWGMAAEAPEQQEPTPVAKKEDEPEADKPAVEKPAIASKEASAAFCAELSGKYYYPTDSDEAAKLNKRKIVYYKSEGEAEQAGKKKFEAKEEKEVAQTMESANALMAKGRELYTKAVDMGATYERDKYYGEAFGYLTQAMLIYRGFYEKDESNEKLGETLRVCMEMRYGAMKNKRP
jgi:hypothetical protein